jgi:hypothetical protein
MEVLWQHACSSVTPRAKAAYASKNRFRYQSSSAPHVTFVFTVRWCAAHTVALKVLSLHTGNLWSMCGAYLVMA